MEGFSKIDIYATKGVEYIFVIGYLIILIVYWKISNKQVNFREQVQKVFSSLSANILRIPQGLFFSRNHTWSHLEETGVAKVGLDDFIQHVTGRVDFTTLKNPGEKINKGDILAEITQKGKLLKVFSPISGKIVDTNSALYDNPEILNEDPYEQGWLCSIEPDQWVSETKSYFLAKDATNWLTKELERFKDFLAVGAMRKYSSEPSMVMLQDGGEIRDHVLSELPEEIWNNFQDEFLNIDAHQE